MRQKSRLRRKRDAMGWMFILPWFIGLLFFFIQPMVSFFRYSFVDFEFTDGGYALKPLEDGLFSHYIHAFTGDAEFPQLVMESLRDLLYQVPVVVFFSLFVAVILNQKFHGRMALRVIFFLPIIITSGVIAEIIKGDMSAIATLPASGASNIFDVSALTQFLLDSGLPQNLTDMLGRVIANVADLVWSSGVQILIFMAALLAIPPPTTRWHRWREPAVGRRFGRSRFRWCRRSFWPT